MKFGKKGEAVPQPQAGLVETQRDLRDLRLFLLEMALAMHRGEPTPLDSPSLMALLELPEDSSQDLVLQRITAQCARIVGTQVCPECQGRVEVREHLVEGPCPWCGASIHFAAKLTEE